ncbi:hypothetical protein Tco_1180390, partial [Tanacetum coccineum]
MLEEESRSKMLLEQSDPMVLEKKVNIKPINYAELKRLSEDFGKRLFHNKEQSDNKLSVTNFHPKLTNLLYRLSNELLENFLRRSQLDILGDWRVREFGGGVVRFVEEEIMESGAIKLLISNTFE